MNRKHPYSTPNCSSLQSTHHCLWVFKIQVWALGSSAQTLEVFYCLIPGNNLTSDYLWFSQSVLPSCSGLKVIVTVQGNITAPLRKKISFNPCKWQIIHS